MVDYEQITVVQKKGGDIVPSFYGEGIWVIWQGKRCELNGISLENFKSLKEQLPEHKLKAMSCSIGKDNKRIEVTLDQLELADPQ